MGRDGGVMGILFSSCSGLLCKFTCYWPVCVCVFSANVLSGRVSLGGFQLWVNGLPCLV